MPAWLSGGGALVAVVGRQVVNIEVVVLFEVLHRGSVGVIGIVEI